MSYEINLTYSDPVALVQGVTSQINITGAAIMIFIWAVIGLPGYFAQDRRTGRGHMPMWLTIGGFFAVVSGFVLFLIAGIVDLYTLVTSLVIFILCAGWFIFSGDKS